MIENLIDPIPTDKLLKELTRDIFIRPTNNASNEIYIFKGDDKPNLMAEVGRLRELTFRAAGGGTGKSLDIDEYDSGPYSYSQLIVWDPLENQPEYQPSLSSRKGLFSLDNLWDGLGALVVMNTEYKYFFGKITMYSDFNKEARDLILSFMDHYFPDEENLVCIPSPIQRMFDCSAFLHELDGLEYKEGHKLLNSKVRELGENIPPLFNSYMNLSPTMRTFGTAINHHFGDVEETGIMVSIGDIYDQKKDRHVRSYTEYLESL